MSEKTQCPRRTECFHRKGSKIGPSGRCPDCGTQVSIPVSGYMPTRGRQKMPGRSCRIRTARLYDGGLIDF